jgi:hypothetical protein
MTLLIKGIQGGFRSQKLFCLGYLILFFLSAQPSLAQLNLTVDASTPERTTTVTLETDTVLFLNIDVFDADYDAEGELYINEQGPIVLFPGGNNGNNDVNRLIQINLNNTQRSYFQRGANTLRFTFLDTEPFFDGYRINSVAAIESIPTKAYEEIIPRVDESVSDNRQLALEIYKRLAGITTPIDNPVLIEMERHIDRGDLKEAAKIATTESSFYNLVVRDFAARMSTREVTINEPFNDFIATFIGVTRDDLDARTLLTGNHFYMGNSETNVPSNIEPDLLLSNNHYARLEADNYDFASVLTRVNTQYIRIPGGDTVPHPDAAGVITSRTFMAAHAVDGTNRRPVEFTFNQFTCFEMEEWGDATATDIRVGQDIDRFPGGEGANYQTTCKACHSVMDGFRGAFARYDYSDNFVKYAPYFPSGNGRDRMQQSPAGVSRKLNINSDTFSGGFRTTDDSWVNNARGPANAQRFGWRGVHTSGSGVRQMASAVANSRAFSRCMVKRVYRELCRRPVASFENAIVENMANSFESNNYSLRGLFEDMAIQPECIGVR